MTDPEHAAQHTGNRRRYRRRPMHGVVRISTIDPELDPESGRFFFRTSHETSVDFSLGGLALRTQDPMRTGRRVLVEVDNPDGGAVEAVGRIAWVRVDPRNRGEGWIGVGVEFLGGQSGALAQLDACLDDSR